MDAIWRRLPQRLLPLVLAFAAPICAFAAATGERAAPLQVRLGYPAGARLLIIHADDFGMAHSVDRAISRALENGWVTSASVMVPCPWFPEVVSWSHQHPNADLGIHLVLDSEWDGFRWGPVAPADKVSSLLDSQGYFFNDPSLFRNVKLHEVQTELHAQIDRARAQGLRISHLDSHMIALLGTHHLFEIYEGLGREYNLPIRLVQTGSESVPEGVTVPEGALALDKVITMDPGISKLGWTAWYEKQLSALKPGVYELIVHLAYDDDEMRGATKNHADWGAAWRQQDLDMVSSAEFRRFLREHGFILVNWRELSQRYTARVQPHF